MARRKKELLQIGLSLPTSPAVAPPGATVEPPTSADLVPAGHKTSENIGAVTASGPTPSDPDSRSAEAPIEPSIFSHEDFDDYEEDEERAALLDPPREVTIAVEATGDGFEVSRVGRSSFDRHIYTRAELVELIGRAQAALK